MLITLALIVISIGLFYLILIWNFDYWTKRGITGPKPLPYFGNYPMAHKGKQHMIYDLDNIYRAYKDKEDFVGIFNIRTPQLLILNPQLCQRIFKQDFQHFQKNVFATVINRGSDSISGNSPFALTGEKWKKSQSFIREGLKIETVESTYTAIRGACKKMRLRIEELNRFEPRNGIKIKDLCLNFTSEIITDYIYGFNFYGQPSTKLVFDALFNIFQKKMHMILYFHLTYLIPSLRPFYKARILPDRVTALFQKFTQTAIDLRKSNSAYKNRRDFLNHLLELQKSQNLSTLEMTTHSMNFILHGLLTIYATFTNCLLLLAKNPESQDQLRNEIHQHLEKNEVDDFDKIEKLPYLNACIYETIRIFTPTSFAAKECTEPILLTNKSGRSITLREGEIVLLPLYSIMNDENYYTNANEFRPERFIGSNGSNIDDFIRRGIFYGFGAGPRECVGKQFTLTQIKSGLVEIVRNFKIHVNPKTNECSEIDLKFSILRINNEIYLDFETIR